MAYTNPKTWTSAVLSSSDLNTHLRDNLLFIAGTTGVFPSPHMTSPVVDSGGISVTGNGVFSGVISAGAGNSAITGNLLVGGVLALTGAASMGAGSTVNGLSIVISPNTVRNKIISGTVSSGSVANNTATAIGVTFGFTWGTAPDVVISLTDVSDRSTSNLWGVVAYSITTTGFTAEFLNRTGAPNTCFATWIALGGG